MQEMPKMKRARGERAIGSGAMPPMPKIRSDAGEWGRADGMESMAYGGNVSRMRANAAEALGFGPNPNVGTEPGERERPISAAKSSKKHRDWAYSGGIAIERLTPMLMAEARRFNSLDWMEVIEWSE